MKEIVNGEIEILNKYPQCTSCDTKKTFCPGEEWRKYFSRYFREFYDDVRIDKLELELNAARCEADDFLKQNIKLGQDIDNYKRIIIDYKDAIKRLEQENKAKKQGFVQRVFAPIPEKKSDDLTDTELYEKIVKLKEKGFNQNAIAGKLDISQSKVSRILRKVKTTQSLENN
jgi:hypothetical protein